MGKKYNIVVGLGITGISCVRYFLSKNDPVAVIDSRMAPPNLQEFQQNFPDVPVALGSLDQPILDDACQIILSPGISLAEPVIKRQIAHGVSVIGDIELFAKEAKAPVIAITGTNAKSTVTTLIGEMVKEAGYNVLVGGNLGIPALDLLSQPVPDFYVLELSSFQLETTHSLSSHIATVLNISPDHMDRYTELSNYVAAKHRIYHNCKIAVCNLDDNLTDCPAHYPANRAYFTLNVPKKGQFGIISNQDEKFLAYGREQLLPVTALPVLGRHYQANALAALALGLHAGLPIEPMLHVLSTFNGLPHRCQFVRKYNEVRWYNDSKGTNVGASVAAIVGLGSEISGKLIVIAGGVGKNADFAALKPVVAQYARCLILLGEAADDLAKAMGEGVPTIFASSMEEAVKAANNKSQPNDCVLLSPACASFDMFRNFEHRGDVFSDLVQAL